MLDKIILGTAQLGMNYGINNYGRLSKDRVFEILNYAYDNDIKFLDTAEIYGNALQLIGSFLKANPQKRFQIISKLDPEKKIRKSQLINHIKKYLKILNIYSFHGYMFHNYEHLKKSPDIYMGLQNLKNDGYIENIGISLYENSEIIDISENYNFDFIQVPFNLLDNENKRGEVLKKAKENCVKIHVRSIFLQGLFFKPYKEFDYKLKPLIKYLKKIKQISSKTDIDIDSLAIHYPLKKDYIDNVIFGVHNLNQFSGNIKTIIRDVLIPSEKIEEISVLEEELLKPFNWN